MRYFTGDTRSRKLLVEMSQLGIGRVFTTGIPKPYPGEDWILDNGAYPAFKAGKGMHDTRNFLDRVYWVRDNMPEDQYPYFGVAADIVGGGSGSFHLSIEGMRYLPPDWPWYLPVQDGIRIEDIGHLVDDYFDGIFLGGSSTYKATAKYWCDYAHSKGKLFHYARAGTLKKLWHAMTIGADSCDSALPLWDRYKWNTFVSFIRGEIPEEPGIFSYEEFYSEGTYFSGEVCIQLTA